MNVIKIRMDRFFIKALIILDFSIRIHLLNVELQPMNSRIIYKYINKSLYKKKTVYYLINA